MTFYCINEIPLRRLSVYSPLTPNNNACLGVLSVSLWALHQLG